MANAIGIDVVVAMRVAEFQFGRPTSGRFFLPPPLAALPPFAFAFQAIARRPGGLRLGKRGLVAYLWLVLCQPFRETSDFRFQAMVIGAEALVIGLDFRQAAFQFRPVPFRLSNSSIILLARAHAISIAQVDPVSAPVCPFSVDPPAPPLGHHRTSTVAYSQGESNWPHAGMDTHFSPFSGVRDVAHQSTELHLRLIGSSVCEYHAKTGNWPTQIEDLGQTSLHHYL